MVVAESALKLVSSHVQASWTERQASVQTWTGAAPAATGTGRGETGETWRKRLVEAVRTGVPVDAIRAEDVQKDDEGLSPQDAQKVHLIEALLEYLTGRKVKLHIWNGKDLEAARSGQGAGTTANASSDPGWGAEVKVSESNFESESTTFSAEGSVKTADGTTLQFSFSMGMSRTRSSSSEQVLRLGNAAKKDPLVVDLSGTGVQLTNGTSGLDLNGDGKSENVHFATGTSAFLAHSDGTTPLGGQNLFGPSTGDGFGELAKLDSDGNGWIDAGDPAWADLYLWNRDESGVDHVQKLADSGVQALSLASVDAPFSLRGSDGGETGSVGQLGVWVGSSGRAGAVAHVDLVA
jgi:hypothetical protein